MGVFPSCSKMLRKIICSLPLFIVQFVFKGYLPHLRSLVKFYVRLLRIYSTSGTENTCLVLHFRPVCFINAAVTQSLLYLFKMLWL